MASYGEGGGRRGEGAMMGRKRVGPKVGMVKI